MSRSYRTDPKWRIAERNISRDEEGRPLLPRIIEYPPRIGDVHPTPTHFIAAKLAKMPPELYFGLKKIELRSRKAEPGHPYGVYFGRSKLIRLYSLPMRFRLGHPNSLLRMILEMSGGTIEREQTGYSVIWTDPDALSFWFYYDTFLHELGHHHRAQYPSKTGLMGRDRDEESMAERYRSWVAFGRFSEKKYQQGKCALDSDERNE